MILFRKTPHDRYRTYHLCEAGRNDGSLLWPVFLASLRCPSTGEAAIPESNGELSGLLEIRWQVLAPALKRSHLYFLLQCQTRSLSGQLAQRPAHPGKVDSLSAAFLSRTTRRCDSSPDIAKSSPALNQ